MTAKKQEQPQIPFGNDNKKSKNNGSSKNNGNSRSSACGEG
jgi:hypothetical protein